MTPTKTTTTDPDGRIRIIEAGQGEKNDSYTKDEIKKRMENTKEAPKQPVREGSRTLG